MANTLWEYFNERGQGLPSVQQRRQMFGLGNDYVGTAEQNNALLARLQGGGGGGNQGGGGGGGGGGAVDLSQGQWTMDRLREIGIDGSQMHGGITIRDQNGNRYRVRDNGNGTRSFEPIGEERQESAADIARRMFEEEQNRIKEQVDFLKDFLKKNPFGFDQNLAKQASESKFSDYFNELLNDFINPLLERIERSQTDMNDILGNLVRRRENVEEEKTQAIEEGLERARAGFAEKGTLFGGASRRAAAKQRIQGQEELEDFLTESQFEENTTKKQFERDIADTETDISLKKRDIARDKTSAIENDIKTREAQARQKHGLRAYEAVSSRFGQPLTQVPDYLKLQGFI